jgi:predicted nucleic acid-binding protein
LTLTAAGPLIALIDADEVDHVACLEALDELWLPLVTTWPTFTEALYLLARVGGIQGQRALWRLVHTGRPIVADLISVRARTKCPADGPIF